MDGRRGERSGSEPVTARSALGARAALSGVVLPLALAAGVVFAVLAVRTGEAVWWVEAAIAAAVAPVAAADLLVLRRRMRDRHEAARR